MNNIIHENLITSSLHPDSDENNWITTTSNPQVVEFIDYNLNRKYVLNSLTIENSSIDVIKIKINNDNSEWIFDAGQTKSITLQQIEKITIVSPIGAKFRYEGQSLRYVSLN